MRGTLPERLACFELEVTFGEVAAAAARLLSTGGKFYTVFPVTRLAEAMATLKAHRLEPKRLQILRPAPNKPPHIFLSECRKDGNEGLTVLPEKTVGEY